MNQSNLRAATLYLILSAFASLPIYNLLEIASTDPLDTLFRLLQVGTEIWIIIALLSSKRKQQDYTRLIGLYLLFSISMEIIVLPYSIRSLAMSVLAQVHYPILIYLGWMRSRVTTILFMYVSVKLLRKQIDKNLFLSLSIISLMYIVRLLSNTNFGWMFQYIPGMETIVNLISSCASLGFYIILAVLFFETSGRKLVFKGDEKRVIKWVGVALFLMGFRYLTSCFWLLISRGFQLWQTVTLLSIWGIQAVSLIYLSKRVRAYISQE